MKKFLSLLLSFTMLMTITAGLDLSAYAAETNYTCGDNITAVYDSTTKVLTISGFGDMPDYTSASSNRAPWYSNRANITTVVFTDDEDDNITSIGNYAFYGFSKITTIEIPASVTSIGSYAFNGCSQLTSIELPENVTSIGTYSFYQCTKLANVTLSEKLTEIPMRAFSSCTTLTSIDIPDSVTSIGERAFMADTALQTVNFGTGLQSIGTYAFSGCTKLNAVTLDQSEELTSIDTYAFNGCTAIGSITLNDGLVTIGNYAFYNCKSVTSLEIPSTVTSIGNDAFESCSGMETAVVNGAVGNNAFKNCTSLADLTLCDTVTSIGTSAFDGSSSLLEEIIIPDATTSIGDYAFRYCAAAKTIVIGEGVTTLGSQAFANNANASQLETLIINAKNLTFSDSTSQTVYPFYRAGQASDGVTVIFGDAVENIPAYLFNLNSTSSQYLYNITSITLGTNVKNIGRWAFRNLFSLEELVINSESINDLTSSDQAFYKVGSSAENGLSVTFGDTVKNIPAYLFYDSATNNNNNYTASITSLDLGESVETIGAYAFYFIRTLTDEIVVPDSTTTVGEHAFQLCYETSLVTGKNLTTVGATAFQGSYLTDVYINSSDLSGWVYNSFSGTGYSSGSVAVTFGENVQSVPTEFLMMTTATSLAISIPRFTSVTFENADTIVDEYAFSNWIYLTDIDLPADTTVINDGILYSCTALQDVEIPESVTTIGACAFEFSGITSIDIPASVTTIGDSAFYGTALESVIIPDTVTDLGASVFASCDSLSSVTIGSGIDTLPSKTFQYCSALTDITIPDTITSIASYAFYGSAVTNVTLSENLESIGLSAFAYCENLESLAIPSSVTSIAGKAFLECTALEAGTEDNKLVSYDGTEYQWNTLVALGDENEALAYNERIIFLEHDHDFTGATPVSNNDGTHTYTCTADGCDGSDGYQTTESCTYSYAVTTEPTYTSTGVGTYTCTVCGYSYTVEIAALVAPSDDSTTSGDSPSTDSSSTATTTPASAAIEDTIPLVTGTKFKSRTTSSITITWIKADGITNYAIYQYNYSTDDYELIDTVGDVTQYKVTGLKAGTKYKFKVAAIKDGVIGRRGTCYVKTVTKPKKVTVKSVKASSKAFTVKWNKRNSDGYQVQYATNKKFTKNKKSVTVKGKKNTSKKISGLKKNTKYYVRVRAYKTVNGKKVYGSWSTVKVVTTK